MQNPSPPAYSEQTALQTKQPQAQAAPAFDRKVWHGYGGERGGPWKIGICGCFEAKDCGLTCCCAMSVFWCCAGSDAFALADVGVKRYGPMMQPMMSTCTPSSSKPRLWRGA